MADPLSLSPPRQTLGYIRARLDERGILPKSKLGQNFLVDLNLLDVLLDAAELDASDLVIEVGSGTGSLTARLAEQAGAVLGVEVDADLHRMSSELMSRRQNVEIINADVLRTKNELHPDLFHKLAELKQRFNTSRFKLIANLPYAVATPVIANLLLSDWVPERIVATVQWEIAERLTAQPGDSEYAALAVLIQSIANVEILRRLPPDVFWPRPQVDSAFVRIVTDAEKRAAVGDVRAFRVFLRDLYVHKRKSLRAALIGWPSGRRDKHSVDSMLEKLAMPHSTRAEELDLEQHRRLWQAFHEAPV